MKAAAHGTEGSQTLRYATTAASNASILDGGMRGGNSTRVFIRDSGGLALEEADKAFYSPKRPANLRIHWMFDPQKDLHVQSLLTWVQAMSYALATVGVSMLERNAITTS